MKHKQLLIFLVLFSVLAASTYAACDVYSADNFSSVASAPSDIWVSITWATDSAANSSINYGTTNGTLGTKYGTNDNVTSHTRTTGRGSLVKNTVYYYNVTSVPSCNKTGGFTVGPYTFTTLDPALDSDVLMGLPDLGEDVGSFLSNLAPGVGTFIIIIGVFGGIAAIVFAVVVLIKLRFTKEPT